MLVIIYSADLWCTKSNSAATHYSHGPSPLYCHWLCISRYAHSTVFLTLWLFAYRSWVSNAESDSNFGSSRGQNLHFIPYTLPSSIIFPPFPCNKLISPPFSHLPSHTPPLIHWCEEQWRNIWLLKRFINATLSRTAGRLLTAFTRQHRHIGQPCQPCAAGEPHLSPLRGCLAAHRPGAGLHYSSSCNQASLAGLCCLHIWTSPSLLFIYLYTFFFLGTHSGVDLSEMSQKQKNLKGNTQDSLWFHWCEMVQLFSVRFNHVFESKLRK